MKKIRHIGAIVAAKRIKTGADGNKRRENKVLRMRIESLLWFGSVLYEPDVKERTAIPKRKMQGVGQQYYYKAPISLQEI